MERTWQISDIDGGNKRTVTLAQYRAEIEAAKKIALAIHQGSLANAHLIAAAPDLLAALEGIKAHADYAEAYPEDMSRKLNRIAELARAAIAKATGDQ